MSRRFHSWWLLPGIIFLDQLTKWQAGRLGWVGLNSGLALGWGGSFSGLLIVVLISAVILGVILAWRQSQLQSQLGVVLVLAGGISNLIDRLIWGGVRDFIPMIWWHNNLADIAIVVGLGLFLVRIYQSGKISQKNYV